MKLIDDKEHILVFNRSFWPDVEATGQFLTELCEDLAKKYKITVIAGRSYYGDEGKFGLGRFWKREIFNGIEILRIRHTQFWKRNLIGRIINWITYGMFAFIIALTIKPRMIVVCTDPPFLGIIGMIISRLRAAPFIYNCNDLFPDVAWELGRLRRNNWIGQLFDYVNKKAFCSAYLVVCLGSSMENRIRQKRIGNAHIKVITHWVDTSKIKPIPKDKNPLVEELGLGDKIVIMYSGNIGLSQDFSSILQAVSTLKDKFSFYLVFVGEGAGKARLKNETRSFGLNNILFLSYQPKELLSFSLSMADLHLIPLKKGMAGAVVPSKIYGIMAAARPYLAISDRDSEPARLVNEFGCGLWAEPDDLEMITQKINWAIGHPKELEEMGIRGRAVAEKKFDKNLVINEWLYTLEKLEEVWYP